MIHGAEHAEAIQTTIRHVAGIRKSIPGLWFKEGQITRELAVEMLVSLGFTLHEITLGLENETERSYRDLA